jgi:hypothetical protein
MVRTTVIGLLNLGVSFDDIRHFVNEKLAAEPSAQFKTVLGKTITENGEERLHVKFSRLTDIDTLDHRWNLRISHEFRQAGFGDVAWKFTEVDSDTPGGEDTTVSIHPGLFDACLDEEKSALHYKAPPEPFGSEAFWQWFDEIDR